MKQKSSLLRSILTVFLSILQIAQFSVAQIPFWSIPAAQAAIPSTIGYQGRLKNSSGVAQDGNFSFTFRLYASSTGGTALWTEIQPTVAVDDGVFAVQLGSVTSFPSSLDFNQPLFLTTEVNSDGEMTPRVVVNSVPYAMTTAGVNALSAAPGSATGGRMYYDTTNGSLNYYDGISGIWKSISSASGSSFTTLNWTNATGSNANITNVSFVTASGTDVSWTNGSGVNTTSTNFFTSNGSATNFTTTNATATSLFATNGSMTNGTITNGTISNLTFTNGTSTGWLGFSTASGTNLFASNIVVNGSPVCLANGTNCPLSTASGWTDSNASNTLYVTTSTRNVLFGGSTTATAGFVYDGSTSSVGLGVAVPQERLDVAGNIQNIVQPSSLFSVATSSIGGSSNPMKIRVRGEYAYVINSGNDTLHVIDISRADQPGGADVVGSVVVGSNPTGLAINGRYGYVVNQGSDTMQVIDVSRPAAPIVIATVSTGDRPHSIVSSGHFVYVTNSGDATVSIFDISNPLNPHIESTATVAASPTTIAIQGRYLYVANSVDDSISSIDIADPFNPVVFTTPLVASPHGLAVQGRFAYTADDAGTLQVLDIANSNSIASLYTVSIETGTSSVALAGRYAYVLNQSTGNLQVFDISNAAAQMALVKTVNVGGASSQDVVVQGRYVYTANASSNSISAIDIGGTETNGLIAASVEFGRLEVLTDAHVNNQLNVGGGLTVGVGGLVSAGGLGGSHIHVAGGKFEVRNDGVIRLGAQTSTPATSATDTLGIYTQDFAGFTTLHTVDETGLVQRLGSDLTIIVYNQTGSTISKGQAVYLTGSFGGVPSVGLARSNSALTMPALGLTQESIPTGSYGRIIGVGILSNIDTSGFSTGEILYVSPSTAGSLTNVRPALPSLPQVAGQVIVSSASTGSVQVVLRPPGGTDLGTIASSWRIGAGTPGTKSLTFNGTATGTLSWNPQTSSTVYITDKTGFLTVAATSTFADGAVPFALGNGTLSQDATNFVWDSTNTRLLIQGSAVCLANGTNCPSGTVSDFQTVTNAGNTTTQSIQFAGGTSTGDFRPSVDATLNLGSSAFRWNGFFADLFATNVTTTNLFASNLSATTGTFSDLSTTNATIETLNATSGTIGTISATNISATNATLTNLVVSSLSNASDGPLFIPNLLWTNATGTNTTSTNLFVVNGQATNFTGTNVTTTEFFTTNGSISNLTFTNGTSTGWFGFGTASGTSIAALQGNVTNLLVGNVTSTNATTTNFFATNATIQNLTVTGVSPSSFANLTWTNATGTNTTSTNLAVLGHVSTDLLPSLDASLSLGSSALRWNGNFGFVTTTNLAAGTISATTGTFSNLSLNNIAISGAISEATYLDFSTTTANPTHREGRLFYDNTQKALSYYNESEGITMNIGRESWIRVRNTTGGTIPNGSVVYVSGSDISFGLPTVDFARADATSTVEMIGVATQDILNGGTGYITAFGVVHDLNTAGLEPGAGLYLSAATSGAFTTTPPTSPNISIRVGVVENADATTGSILVLVGQPRNGAINLGSVGFGDANGFLTQDPSNFYWDDSNNRLGIGTNAPSATLHVAGQAQLDGLTFANATGTNTTSTNLFSVNGRFTNLVSTNGSFTELSSIGTTSSWIGFTNASGTNFNTVNGFIANLTSPNATISGGSINGTPIGAITPSTGAFTNLTSDFATSSVFFASNATIGSLTLQGALGLSDLTWTSATGSHTTTTHLFASVSRSNQFTSGSVTATTLGFTNGTSTGWFGFGTASGTNIASQNVTTTHLFVPGFVQTNLVPVTDSVLSLGSQGLRWNGNFGTVTTTELFASSVSSSVGIFETLTGGSGGIASLNFTNGTSTGWFGFTLASGTTLNAQNLFAVDATSTNATTTNLFALNGAVTNLTATNATFTNIVLNGTTPSTFENITWTNATGTNTTSSRMFANILRSSTLVSGSVTATTFTFVSGTTTNWLGFTRASGTQFNALVGGITTFTSPNATISGGSINNTRIGNTTPSTGVFTNVTSTNATSTNLYSDTALFANLTVSGISSFQNQLWTNATGTNTTSTNLYALNGTIWNALFEHSTTSHLIVTGDSNIQNLTFSNATGTNLATTGTVTSTFIRAQDSIIGTATASRLNVDTVLRVGVGNFPVIGNSVAQFGGDVDTYLQVNIQNHSTGTNASSDFVATNDIGDDSSYFIDMGINGSNYANPDYSIGGANDGYLLVNGGNLTLGTASASTDIVFHAGGTESTDEVMRITSDHFVGIGTDTPSSTLHVAGLSTLSDIVWTNATGTNTTSTNIAVLGSTRLSSDTRVNNVLLCLADGTNCPSGTTPNFQTVTNAGNTTTRAIVFNGGTSTGAFIVGNNFSVTGTTELQAFSFTNATGTNLALSGRVTSDLIPLTDSAQSLGASAFRWNAELNNVTTTNVTTTNIFAAVGTFNAVNIAGSFNANDFTWVNATGTQTTSTYLAILGSARLPSNTQVNNVNICLADGTNCPSGTTPNFQTVTNAGNTTTNSIVFNGGTSTGGFVVGNNLSVTGTTQLQNVTGAYATFTNLALTSRADLANVSSTNQTVSGTLSVSGASSLGSLTFTDATGTSVTSTNLFATNGSFTNGTMTNGTISNLSFTNGTSTSWFGFSTATGTTLGALSANITSLTAPTLISSNATISGGSLNGTPIGNITPSTGVFTNVTSTNVTSTNVFATNATFANLTVTNATFTNIVLTGTAPSSFANLIWTSATGTNTTSTNLFVTSGRISNLTVTGTSNLNDVVMVNATTTNLVVSNRVDSNLIPSLDNMLSLGSSSLRWNAQLSHVTTTDLHAISVSSTSGLFQTFAAQTASFTGITFANGTSTGSFAFAAASGTSVNALNGTVNNLVSQNATISGGSINGTTIGAVTPSTGVFTNVTTTNVTSTSFFTSTANVTNLTVSNATFTNIALTGTAPSSFANLIWTNATGTNTTSTNLFSVNGRFTNLVSTNGSFTELSSIGTTSSWIGFTNASGTNFNTVNGFIANLTSPNATISGGSINGTPIGALSPSTGAFTNLTSDFATSSVFFASNATIGSLTVQSVFSPANLTWSNATGTNTTSTNLFASISRALQFTSGSVTATTLEFTNGTSTGWFGFGTASGTSIASQNVTTTNLFVPGFVQTNLIPVADAILSLGSQGLRWNAQFSTVTTTNLVTSNATISGGSINGTPIGVLSPSTGIFTNATATHFFATNLSATNFTPAGITWTNATGTNTTSTFLGVTGHASTTNLFAGQGIITSGTIQALTFTNGTSTGWFGFTSASGTTFNTANGSITSLSAIAATATTFAFTSASGSTLRVSGQSVCLQNGANCPVNSLSWTDNETSNFMRPTTATRDLVIGATASATAPFYFDVGSPTSSLQIGRNGNANLFVGSSTYGGGLNSLFVMNGDDAFIQGNLGVASSVYTNGSFVVGSGSTYYSDGSITKTDGAFTVTSTGDIYLMPSGNMGVGTTTPAHKLTIDGNVLVQRSGTGAAFIMNRTDGIAGHLRSGTSGAFFGYENTGFFAITRESRSDILTGIGALGNATLLSDANGNIGIGVFATTSQAKLQVIGNVSSTGLLTGDTTSTNATTTNMDVLGTFNGAGLTDCDAIDRKLLWDATTRQFVCGNDLGGNMVTNSSTASTALGTSQTRLITATTTPDSASAEIWIVANATVDNDSGVTARDLTFQLRRGSTCAGTQVGTNVTAHLDAGGTETEDISMSFIDAPNTTSPQGYTLCGATGAGSPTVTARNITLQDVNVGADLAEVYYSPDDTVAPGEIVNLSFAAPGQVVRSQTAYDSNVLGIISTQPGMVLSESAASGTPVLVALAGRVPVKVTASNGPIVSGDYLTSSEVPGMAMKATQAGVMIGRALEGFDPATAGTSTGKIMVFVQNGFYLPNTESMQMSASGEAAGPSLQETGQTPEIVLPIGSSEYTGVGATKLVVQDATFTGRVTVRGQVYLGKDSVGQAKILSGDTEVHVTFEKPYLAQPIVTVTPQDFVDSMYRVTDITDAGFTIQMSFPQSNDKLFNWHAFGSNDAELTVSDGSVEEIDLVVSDVPQPSEEIPTPTSTSELPPEEPTEPSSEPVIETPTEEPASEPIEEEVVQPEEVAEEEIIVPTTPPTSPTDETPEETEQAPSESSETLPVPVE